MLDMGGSHGSQALEHSGSVGYCDPRKLVTPCCGADAFNASIGAEEFTCKCCGNPVYQMVAESAYQAQLLRDNNS